MIWADLELLFAIHRPSFQTGTLLSGEGAVFFGGCGMISDLELRQIFAQTQSVAVVGWSANPDRPSHRVAAFLRSKGFRVIPVNPGHAGQDAGWGELVFASLADIPGHIDMVDIFRKSADVGPIVDQAIEKGAKTIWMQLGVIDDLAATRAETAGLLVVMDRCPAIEMPRLGL
jgi:predicted CoA-binding protein